MYIGLAPVLRGSFFRRSSAGELSHNRLYAGAGLWSRSARRTHPHSVSVVQPILPAIEVIAAHYEPCSSWCSSTIRVVRSHTSAEYFTGLVIAPASQELWSPEIPRRINTCNARLALQAVDGTRLLQAMGHSPINCTSVTATNRATSPRD